MKMMDVKLTQWDVIYFKFQKVRKNIQICWLYFANKF